MMRRKGFTLVELVVVILILGILAGVAAPKMLNTSAKATENGLKQTLSIVRDAIELFQAQNNGAAPNTTTNALFIADLKPYMRGAFPKNPVHAGAAGTAAEVKFGALPADNTTGWLFITATSEFVCNTLGNSPQGTGAYTTF